MIVQFEVAGKAAPQGSKNPWGGEANPRTKPWRAAVSDKAAKVMNGAPASLKAVKVYVTFSFPRPKSHYRTGKFSDILREDAPHWHTTFPDADKLQRAIGDALTGIVYRDDKQIASWAVDKIYSDRAYARITVKELGVENAATHGSSEGASSEVGEVPARVRDTRLDKYRR